MSNRAEPFVGGLVEDSVAAPNAPVRHAVQYDHLHQQKLTA
ncbi:hypothetical protein [Arthrobacter sp. UYEF3]